MPALVKQLLLDYALNRVSVDVKSDLTIAIQDALSSGVFSRRDVSYFIMYLAGYNAIEIAARYTKTTDHIEQQLERMFTAIEEYSGYTDQSFIHKLQRDKKYRKGGIHDLTIFLEKHGKEYLEHDMVNKC